jgi:ATP-binding cassette subfamily C protein
MRQGHASSQGGIRPRVARLILAVALFSVFTNLLMLTGPLFMLQVYDRVLASRSEETLVALFGLVAVLYLFYWLLEFARGRVAARAGARIQSAFDQRLFDAALEDAALRGGQSKGAPLAGLAAVRAFFTSPVFLALFDLPWTPLFAACIFIFHPLLGWIALAGGAILILATLANQLLTAEKVKRANQLSAAADRVAKQAEDASELIWAQGMGRTMNRRWRKMRSDGVESAIRAADWTGTFSSFTRGFRLFLQSAILAVGAWLVLKTEITAGAMIAASILMGRALAPIEQTIGGWQIVQNARSGWTVIRDTLKAIPERRDPLELPRPLARLAVDHLTIVARAGEKPILRDIDFGVAPGEALGVIGKSGSGKSTLARAIMGLVRPVHGEVRLNGATLDQYGPERLGRHIGYLPQNIQLFDGTIAENIAHMDPEPDAAKVVAAAQKARVHEIVLDLPQGYETRIGAADAQLSGGQKQRLALARALYHDPVILVLDEPNSALDADGSEALNAVVREMKASDRSVLIMTHRPTAISACDRLLVLDRGVAKGCGPRDEIIRSMMRNASEVHRVVTTGGG